MSLNLVKRLLSSFDELERCITVTKEVLSEKEGVPEDVLSRVNQYTDIVAKQRKFALELESLIDDQRWDDVARHIKLINGLSAMIRDDAQAILSGAYDKVGSGDIKAEQLC